MRLLSDSVWDHQPKNLKTGHDPEKKPVAIQKIFRSQPVIGRDPKDFLGRDLEILRKIYQNIHLDESSIKFSIGSRPKKFQPGRLIPVATVFGSRSDIFLGRDP